MTSSLTRRQALALIGATGSITMASESFAAPAPAADDPYLWLEDVQGEKALNWVRERNAGTRALLEAQPHFASDRQRFKEILDSKERIPMVGRDGDWLYNFWRDQTHPRGLWRRTTLASYRTASPEWDVVLDLDALAKAEGENWVWSRVSLLKGRAMISLSRGGADATVVREFDMASRQFVKDGFALPEAKSEIDWLDADHLLVGTDFGPGSLTDSGYARVIKLWKRGQPLSAAVTVYEAQTKDVAAFATVDHTPGFERVIFGRSPDFFTNELALWDRSGKTPKLVPISIKPKDGPGAQLLK